jgi:catechol 2,3-dioxygenase-like lactoylglutathione lyase family enzyme
MKKVLLIAILLASQITLSQNFSFRIDHYSMVVKDLDKTADFYASVLGLEAIPHPARAEGFKWFSIDGVSQLHLIRKDSILGNRSKSEHLCLSIKDLDEFTAFLKAKKIPFWDWEGNLMAVTLRADGVRQIYLQDPEDNWIEVNDAGRQE